MNSPLPNVQLESVTRGRTDHFSKKLEISFTGGLPWLQFYWKLRDNSRHSICSSAVVLIHANLHMEICNMDNSTMKGTWFQLKRPLCCSQKIKEWHTKTFPISVKICTIFDIVTEVRLVNIINCKMFRIVGIFDSWSECSFLHELSHSRLTHFFIFIQQQRAKRPLTSRDKIQYDAGAISMYTVYTFILAYTHHIWCRAVHHEIVLIN